MDYLDHHSKLMKADLLRGFDADARVRIADCIVVIAEDLGSDSPEPDCALIAVNAESASLTGRIDSTAHMLCVRRAEFERTVRRVFPDDVVPRVVATLFPSPQSGRHHPKVQS